MKRFLSRHSYEIVLFFLVAIIALFSYKPGTFLTGWDTLHPEFDFGLNFERLINGVWREEQGLGALTGHSHMADLPRVVILWILHFILPLGALRYTYIYACLFFGPWGIYKLVKYLIAIGGTSGRDPDSAQRSEHWREGKSGQNLSRLISFLSAAFYLLNLSTVQQFYAPFEMFTTQYATLPWIILYSLEYLNKTIGGTTGRDPDSAQRSEHWRGSLPAGRQGKSGQNLSLLKFAIVTLLSTPQAYAAHLWYPFFGIFALFLFVYTAVGGTTGRDPDTRADRGSKAHGEHWRGSLPAGRQGKSGQNLSRFIQPIIIIIVTLVINSFWLLPNLYYVLTSSSTPRESKQNRIFSQEYRLRNQENGYIQDVALAKGFYFQWSSYNFEKNRFEYLMPEWRTHLNNPIVLTIGYTLFGIVIFGMFLAIKQRNRLLLSFIPFFLIPFAFLMNHTFPFDRFFEYLLRFSLFEEALRFVFTKFSVLLIFSYTIYFSYALAYIFKKAHSDKHLNVLTFVCFAGLIVYCFPMVSGKLISGRFQVRIPQDYFKMWELMKTKADYPVLTLPLHTFSGWQYYNWGLPAGRQGYQGAGFIWFGMKQAVLDRDSDRWSTANEQAFRELQYTLYSQRAEDFHATLQKFGIGYILWDTSNTTPSEKNRRQIVFERETKLALQKLETADKIRKITQIGSLALYENRSKTPKQSIQQISTAVLPQYRWNYLDTAYLQHGTYVSPNKSVESLPTTITYPFRPMLTYSDRLNKDVLPFPNSPPNSLAFNAFRLARSQQPNEHIRLKYKSGDYVLEFKTKNFQRGIFVQNDAFPHSTGYVLAFRSRNREGLPLRICLKNLYSNLCSLYDELSRSSEFVDDFFVVPPFESGIGYGLSIDNISYGNYDSINELKDVAVYPLQYDYLSTLNSSSHNARNPSNFLVLNQSYHPGWNAYLNGKELTNHVVVNNWANGWELPDKRAKRKEQIAVVFWPQYLEYLGFGLLGLAFLSIFWYAIGRHARSEEH